MITSYKNIAKIWRLSDSTISPHLLKILKWVCTNRCKKASGPATSKSPNQALFVNLYLTMIQSSTSRNLINLGSRTNNYQSRLRNPRLSQNPGQRWHNAPNFSHQSLKKYRVLSLRSIQLWWPLCLPQDTQGWHRYRSCKVRGSGSSKDKTKGIVYITLKSS